MKRNPDFVKISYHSEIFKLRPVPMNYESLIDSLADLIPNSPSCPFLSYKDESGDQLRICNDKSLETYYIDLSNTPNLILNLEVNLEEIIEKNKSRPRLRSSGEDIINLSILGIIDINDETLKSIQLVQTDFSKTIISEIITMIKDIPIENIAEKFNLPWEVIFYMTQEPGFNQKTVSKKIEYYKFKNILRPSKCASVVKDFLENKAQRNDILNEYKISSEKFDQWVTLFKKPIIKPIELSHIPDKEKLKLVSCFLLDKLSEADLYAAFKVDFNQIVSWALYFCKEQNSYQREKFITAEEKYDILERYFKGEYTITQFQNDYGVRGTLLYRWVKCVQTGKTLQGSSIFRTASEELEQAYNIFLNGYR